MWGKFKISNPLYLKYFVFLFIGFNIFLSMWWILHGNILFHTDIARDFLVINDIVQNHHLTLIGPRAGGIPGVFHGPLWFYINIPAFIIGNGNPVVVGWFWVLLSIATIISTYLIAKKMFGEKEALLSGVLMSAICIIYPRNMLNPSGAIFISPIFFYFFWSYLKTKKFAYLCVAVFLLGLLIQFEMAFGIPIAILSFIYLLFFSIKEKKKLHLFSFLILSIPLSTFFLFDIRHNFLEFHSLIKFLTTPEPQVSFNSLLLSRIQTAVSGFHLITSNESRLTLLTMLILLWGIFNKARKKDYGIKDPLTILIYFYVGFWIIAVFFNGIIWDYYYSSFVPLMVLALVSIYRFVNKYLFILMILLLVFVNIKNGIPDFKYNSQNQDPISWTFNHRLSQEIFKQNTGNFGYFIFTPDRYGYSSKYSMLYTQNEFKNVTGSPFEKKRVTYLIIAPIPKDRPDINFLDWEKSDLGINKKPNKVLIYKNGFRVERFDLNDEEIKVPSNPNLIEGINSR